MAAVPPPPPLRNPNNNANAPPPASFFVGAPCTKVVTLVTTLATAWTTTAHPSPSRRLPLLRGVPQWVWQLLRPWTFGSLAQGVLGGLWMVWHLRRLEREFSTRKTVVWGAWVTLTSHVLYHVLFTPYLRYYNVIDSKNDMTTTGPYALLGALMYYFHHYTPRITPTFVTVLGFSFSDKLWHYLWFAQVVVSGNGTASMLQAGLGYLASAAYDRWLSSPRRGGLLHLDVPDAVARVVGRAVSHLVSDGAPRTVLPPPGGRGGGGGGPPVAAAAAPAAAARRRAPPPPPVSVPDEASVEQLTNMGFPRPRVVEALRVTDNDVQRAAERLLTEASSS